MMGYYDAAGNWVEGTNPLGSGTSSKGGEPGHGGQVWDPVKGEWVGQKDTGLKGDPGAPVDEGNTRGEDRDKRLWDMGLWFNDDTVRHEEELSREREANAKQEQIDAQNRSAYDPRSSAGYKDYQRNLRDADQIRADMEAERRRLLQKALGIGMTPAEAQARAGIAASQKAQTAMAGSARGLSAGSVRASAKEASHQMGLEGEQQVQQLRAQEMADARQQYIQMMAAERQALLMQQGYSVEEAGMIAENEMKQRSLNDERTREMLQRELDEYGMRVGGVNADLSGQRDSAMSQYRLSHAGDNAFGWTDMGLALGGDVAGTAADMWGDYFADQKKKRAAEEEAKKKTEEAKGGGK